MERWLDLFSKGLLIIGGLVGIAAGVYIIVRSKTAEILRGERDAFRDKSDRLQEELVACRKEYGEQLEERTQECHAKDIEIADLKARTDLTEIRKGQATILEVIAKQSASILDNQNRGMEVGTTLEKAMIEMVSTLKAMERRLDQGLIMR